MNDNVYKYFNCMTELFVILFMFFLVMVTICIMGFVRMNKNSELECVKVEPVTIESILKPIE